MSAGLPAGEIVMLGAALLAGGAVTGVLSGLFGIGGGAIMVPILYELFGILGAAEEGRLHLAVGTSFAIIIPTSIRAAYAHYQRGAIDASVLKIIGPAAILGVLLGALTAKFSDGGVMKVIWVASASLLSLSLIARPPNWRIDAEANSPAVAAPVGLGVGFLATMMGIGGGAYITPYMTLLGRPIHQAVGTATAFGAIVAIPALIGYIWAGWGEAGLPPGVANYLPGVGEEVGPVLVNHPDVALIAFTGSLKVALLINEQAARTPGGANLVKKVIARWAGRTRSSSIPTPTINACSSVSGNGCAEGRSSSGVSARRRQPSRCPASSSNEAPLQPRVRAASAGGASVSASARWPRERCVG
ncbi:MAG: aldehyde dehydrogenase family protein, partial [Rhodomicrobium sp.]|nr:aldehyde dehydrogenase family protein [Rhodomicrobium sp.]